MRYVCFFLLFALVFTGCSGTNDTLVSSGESTSGASLIESNTSLANEEESSADSSMSFSSVSSVTESEGSVTENIETSSLTQSEKQQQILQSADNDTECHKLITREIDWENEREFRNFAYRLYIPMTSYSPQIDWIDSLYPIECLRDMGDGRSYAVYSMKGGGRCFFFFLEGGDFGNFTYISKTKQKKDFDDIGVGDSFEKVVATDPDARIWEDCSFDYSAHLLKDGILVYEYEDGVIEQVHYSKDFIYRVDYNSETVEYDYSILAQDYPS